MSHQDSICHTASKPHHQALRETLDWILRSADLLDLSFRQECRWNPPAFIFASILWAWSDEKTLTDRFTLARKVVAAMKFLPREPATTYQAFLKMLKTWTAAIMKRLVDAFRLRMRADLAQRFLVAGFPLFGVDGSRLELPRTVSNEKRFSPPKTRPNARRKSRGGSEAKSERERRSREKKRNGPQMWLTTMFHLGAGLPWDWRLGPSDSSERDHLREMIDALDPNALLVADAGYVGYQIWKTLLESGRHLLVRVGANVRLLKKLGYFKEKEGIVYLWPDREAARNNPPLVLRLITAQGDRHPVYLVTSVLDEERLSDKQTAEIYALRWGIELFYRHFKQTFERRKLRSRTADNAELEATWSLLGLWAMGLHAEVELSRQNIPTRRISVAKVLQAYRKPLREYKSRPDRGESLYELLSKAVIDPYARKNKSSRDYPRKKKPRVIGDPQVLDATPDQIDAARKFTGEYASRLTA
ncbi:MAG: IS4-like element ISRba3 family transposase [Isosphaeraceae bacterium]